MAVAASLFRKCKIETPELDARILLCHAAGLGHEAYVSNPRAVLPPRALARFGAFIERRLAGEPVSRIRGYREFYGRSFRIDEHTLDPRPDTETLVEAALASVDASGHRDAPLKLLDLGTGSGAILVTLLAELRQATGIGVDISRGALQVAKANAEAQGVGARASFIAADWLAGIGGSFDLVVANPPYLASGAIGGLCVEVRSYDPLLALDGGDDGLCAYRRIAASARSVLRPGGTLLLEVGEDQAEAVLCLLRQCGFGIDGGNCLWRDLAGRARVVAGRA